MEKYWWHKKKLSDEVSNSKIDKILNIATKNGAYSGKLVALVVGDF